MDVWGWMWLAWLIVTLGGFAGLETWAIVDNKPNNTLSARMRRVLGIHPKKWWRRICIPLFVLALSVFTVWFIPHIWLVVGDMS